MENAIMNLNDMPITMDEPTPTKPTPNQTLAFVLMHNVMNAFMEQIEQVIAIKVANALDEMLANRNTLKLMDEEMHKQIENMIENMIENAIDTHEADQDHPATVLVEQVAADTARETLAEYARKQEGWVTEDQVKDIITEHVDSELDGIDWEEKVKDVLRDML
jgi:hypothetical protein